MIKKYIYTLVIGIVLAISGVRGVMAADRVVIVIDPGHGGQSETGDADAFTGAVYNGLEEKDVNLKTAIAFRDELARYENVDVYLTREDDTALTLQERVEYAQSVDADFLISVHYNASADHNFFGSEIFVSAFDKYHASGYGMAECIMDRWVSYGNTRKDIKTRIGNAGNDYYGIIRIGREADIPTLILEHGYLDNDRDFLRMKRESCWQEMGELDAEGVAKYFGLSKDVVKASVEPTVNIEISDEPAWPDETGPEDVKLVIDSYNSNKGDIEFTLYAYDDESKLMYYGFLLDEAKEDTVFPELELWTGKNGKMTGTYHIQPGYEGPITATVFNVYQIDTKSNVCELVPDETQPDDEEDDALIEQDGENSEEENQEDSSDSIKEIILDNSEAESFELGDINEEAINKAVVDSIEKNHKSEVDSSYTKLIIVGLVAGVVLAVSLVLALTAYSNSRKKRRRNKVKTKDMYDFIEDDD